MSVAARIGAYRRPVLVALGCLFWGLLLASAWDVFGGLPLHLYLNAYFLLLFGVPVAMIVLTLLCGWSSCVEHPYVIIVPATVIALFWLFFFAANSV